MIVNRSIGSYGRFANGMFQIASVIGTARKNNQSFGFDPWFNYDHRDRFGSKEDIDLQKYFVNPLPPLDPNIQYEQINVNWGYDDLILPQGNWDIRGHFQSLKWFQDSIDEVRHYFAMKGEFIHEDVAVHWRAGDYENNPNGYHPRLTQEYYKQAISLFPAGTKFRLFSDNPDEFETMIQPLDCLHLSFPLNYIQDFCVMKTCHSFICSNSSYSLMAAILANQPGKKIICPKKWFGDIANLPTQDLYPEGAIVL